MHTHISVNQQIKSMNKRDKRDHSVTARILFVAATILFVLLSAGFIIQAWIGQKVTDFLEKEPISIGEGYFIADAGKVRVDLTRMCITLTDVTIRLHTPNGGKQTPAPSLHAGAAKISASGIRYRRGGKRSVGSIRIRELSVESPFVTFLGVPERSDSMRNKKGSASTSQLAVNIGRLKLTDGKMAIGVWEKLEKRTYSAEGIDLVIDHIRLGQQAATTRKAHTHKGDGTIVVHTATDSTQIKTPPFRNMTLNVAGVDYTFKNGALKFEVDTLTLDSQKGLFSASRIALLPQYDKTQYNMRVGDHSDWVYIDLHDISGKGVRLPFLSGEKVFHADTLSVASAKIESYKDRNQTQSAKVKPTLYQSIQRIPLGIDISSTLLEKANINYQEVAKGRSTPGLVTLTDMKATVTGLTNRPADPLQQYTIDAEALLFGAGQFNATLSLPADSLHNHFSLRATLGAMPAGAINQVTEALADIRITSGNIHSANIEITGNTYEATSEVAMHYDDIRVAILKKNGAGQERVLLTTLANDVVLKKSNPQGGKLRTGEGEFERDPQKSFWNYLWKTSFAGLKKIFL